MSLFLLLLFAGVALLVLEVFVPGGILGVMGALLLTAAVVVAYLRFETSTANSILVVVALGLLAGLWWWFLYFPQSSLASRVMSRTVVGRDEHGLESLQGRRGTAETPLRPAGMARIDGRRVDVVTDGGFVPAGTQVEVVRVEGSRVVVSASGHEAASG